MTESVGAHGWHGSAVADPWLAAAAAFAHGSTSWTHATRCPKAFTVLELLIVIVILALVAGLAFPLFADTEATRVQAAARLLVADLAYAQVDSISHADDPCVVSFNQSTATYTLARVSTPTTPITEPVTGQPYVTQFGSGRAAEMTGVAIQGYSLGGGNQVVFTRYGALDQASPATIQLQSGGVSITLTIDPGSGEVTVTSN